MAKPRVWTCQRQTNGHKCRTVNPRRLHICTGCGKRRPATTQPTHMAALQTDYAGFVTLNGGDHCALCHRGPTANRRLDRDHDHTTGKARGLLCARCNRSLPNWITPDWLRAAADYLENTRFDQTVDKPPPTRL